VSAPIILASGSAIRAALLKAAGVEFLVESPAVDEEALKASLRAEGVSPRDQSDALAEAKAMRVSARRPGFVIGADQILAAEGGAFDKAETMADARARLLALRGKRHELHCGAVIAKDGAPIWRTIATARLWMHDFSEDFLDRYLAEAGPGILSSVGCYQVESLGVRLFSRIEGDYFGVLGLPLIEVLGALRENGALPK
jgi:septum formation protein